MNNWLRSKASHTFFLLFLYALAINFYYLYHPAKPIIATFSDGFLYTFIVHGLQKIGFGAEGFTILVFVILFLEAIVLNAFINHFKILPKESFFTAFSFLLISCFFPEWHTFSAVLLAGIPLLLFIHQLFSLFEVKHSRGVAFNLGLITGILSLIYIPTFTLVLLVWFALLLVRPFKLSEWILVLIGLFTPWYFFASYLFLTDQLAILAQIPILGLSLPSYTLSSQTILSLLALLIYFLYGAAHLQRYFPTMLIQTRKAWTLLMAFMVITILLPFLPDKFYTEGWLIAFFPIVTLIAYGFNSTKKKWLGQALHLIALGFVLYIQWFQ